MGEALDCLWLRDLGYIYSHFCPLGEMMKHLALFQLLEIGMDIFIRSRF